MKPNTKTVQTIGKYLYFTSFYAERLLGYLKYRARPSLDKIEKMTQFKITMIEFVEISPFVFVLIGEVELRNTFRLVS